MRWTDIEDIAEALEEHYADVNIITLRFTDLQKWVMALPGFNDEQNKCNEKVLEAIQAAWMEFREENS